MDIVLTPLQERDKEKFIKKIQIAFKKAVVEQFGDFDGQIIPREHIIRSFKAEGAESYNIVLDGKVVGGAVIVIKPSDHFFFSPFPSFFTKDSQGPVIFLKHQTTPFFKEVSASRTP